MPSFLILNLPCNGFGDVVFAYKLSNYLKIWYPKSKIKIATTNINKFKQLGISPNLLYNLLTPTYKKEECRHPQHLEFSNEKGVKIKTPIFDYIIVAPLTSDFYPSFANINKLIPYSTKDNTLFLSEYNTDPKLHMHSHITGVGPNTYGLLLTDVPTIIKNKNIKNPYSIIYINKDGKPNETTNCYISFIKMLVKKYAGNDYNKLDIVISDWIYKELVNSSSKKIIELITFIKKYYKNIVLETKEETYYSKDYSDKNKSVLTFRADILPLPFVEMTGLIKYSVKDILLTGDQSMTDALNCCSDKNIWYQIMPWKQLFAKKISIELGETIYKSIKTSCGGLEYIKWKVDYKKLLQNNDFRIKGRKLINDFINGR